MEMKARSVDVLSNRYYDLLYCYHMSRENYWKGDLTITQTICHYISYNSCTYHV